MARSTYPGRVLSRGSKGADVLRVQKALRPLQKPERRLVADGDFGPATERAVKLFQAHRRILADGQVGPRTWARLFKEPEHETRQAKLARLQREATQRKAELRKLKGKRDDASRARAKKVRRRLTDLRKAIAAQKKAISKGALADRAYAVACDLVGVMEVGGNNMGPMVSRIIRENGGTGPEPWCGDFVAYCYRHAGSKSVARNWAAVRLLYPLAGIQRVAVAERGDLVRFTFDHVGMFVRYLGGGYIETIEGNTGASGAVSDSSTGGDGVYRKRRHVSQVRDYLRVTR